MVRRSVPASSRWVANLLHQRLQQSRCLPCCSDCYRVERTSSRAGLTPAVDHHLFTAHPICRQIGQLDTRWDEVASHFLKVPLMATDDSTPNLMELSAEVILNTGTSTTSAARLAIESYKNANKHTAANRITVMLNVAFV